MSYSKFFVSLFTLFLLVSAAYSQNFSEARMIEKRTFPESFHFTAFNSEYSVNAKSGRGQKNVNGRKVSLRLPLEKGDSIDKISFSEFGNDLFLLYEEGDGEAGATQFVRLDGKTNKLKWKIWIPTFNTIGVLDDNKGYFAGVGFIGAIDLAIGKFIWKHEDLYTEKYGKIASFAVPKIETDKVIFHKSESDSYARKNQLVVHKGSGEILSIE